MHRNTSISKYLVHPNTNFLGSNKYQSLTCWNWAQKISNYHDSYACQNIKIIDLKSIISRIN